MFKGVNKENKNCDQTTSSIEYDPNSPTGKQFK